MAGVGPSDGGYSYYKRKIDELEEEYRTAMQRNRAKQEAREARAEESRAENALRQEAATEETISEIRESANRSIEREKENSRAEIKRIKEQTYDRRGRYNGLEAEELKDQLDTTKRALNEQQRAFERDRRETRETYDTRAEERAVEHERELEEMAKRAQEAVKEASRKRDDDGAGSFQAAKEGLESEREALVREHLKEQNLVRRDTQRALESKDQEVERRLAQAEESYDRRSETSARALRDRSVRDAETLRQRHLKETSQLREEIQDLLTKEGLYAKEKGQGTVDAHREFENDWRSRNQTMQSAYEDQIRGMQQKAKEADTAFARLHNRSLQEKDAYFAGVIRQQNLENQLRQQELGQAFEHFQNETQIQRDRERALSRSNHEAHVEKLNQQRDAALQRQAKAYQETMANTRESDRFEIETLQRHVQRQNTTTDTSEISPAAEEAVRRSLAGQYQKTFDAESQRHHGTVESMKREYTQRLNDEIRSSADRETRLQQEQAMERQRSRTELLFTVEELEASRHETLRNQDNAHLRSTETLERSHAQTLEKLRRQYEEILTTTRNDASAKLQAYRQEVEFNSKMAQRAFSARQNELIREYEKKLADQRAEHEAAFDDMKSAADRKLRDAERQHRTALEEQAKQYEQRLAQLEQQHEERERMMTQNYQDQLERMKRSNALLIKKKS